MAYHGLQIVDEFRPKVSAELLTLAASDTKYITLTPLSMWDTVHGIWVHIESKVVTTAAGVMTIQLEGATDPAQTTWTSVGAAVTIADTGARVVSELMRAPNVIAAGSPFATLYPFLRIKFSTPAATVGAVYLVTRTIRGMA